MEKIVVYGYGVYFERNKYKLIGNYDIVAYASSDDSQSTAISGNLKEGKKIVSPSELSSLEYDYVFICTDEINSSQIYFTLLENNIGADKIKFLNRVDAIDGVWNYTATEDNKAMLSDIGGVKVEERHRTDFEITGEIFINNIYNFHIPLQQFIVVDVGMNIGVASLFFASQVKVKKVYSYEPFEDTFLQAIKNIERNSQDIKSKIHAKNFALYNENAIAYVSNEPKETGWRNVLPEKRGNSGDKITYVDAGEELSRIIKENPEDKLVLKIDTEGSEYAIFESLNKAGSFEVVEAIVMEYHNGLTGLTEILDENGFKYFINGSLNGFGLLYAVK